MFAERIRTTFIACDITRNVETASALFMVTLLHAANSSIQARVFLHQHKRLLFIIRNAFSAPNAFVTKFLSLKLKIPLSLACCRAVLPLRILLQRAKPLCLRVQSLGRHRYCPAATRCTVQSISKLNAALASPPPPCDISSATLPLLLLLPQPLSVPHPHFVNWNQGSLRLRRCSPCGAI